jgi:hypothetical protein
MKRFSSIDAVAIVWFADIATQVHIAKRQTPNAERRAPNAKRQTPSAIHNAPSAMCSDTMATAVFGGTPRAASADF